MEIEQICELLGGIGGLVLLLALSFGFIYLSIKLMDTEKKKTQLINQKLQLEIRKLQKELQQDNK